MSVKKRGPKGRRRLWVTFGCRTHHHNRGAQVQWAEYEVFAERELSGLDVVYLERVPGAEEGGAGGASQTLRWF